MKVRELFSHPKTWTKDHSARDSKGYPTASTDKAAVSFCLLGAVRRCYPEDAERLNVINKIEKAIERRFGKLPSIIWFNDYIAESQADVLSICCDADV